MSGAVEQSRFPAKSRRLLAQDDAEEGIVNLKSAIVLNEAEFPEFVHKKIYA